MEKVKQHIKELFAGFDLPCLLVITAIVAALFGVIASLAPYILVFKEIL